MTVRHRRGMVEVPAHTYTRGTQRVVLFGVSHVSGHDFWKKANTYISELESKGFEVQFEAIKNDLGEDAPKLSPDYKLLAEIAGLQDQRSGLTYKPHWKWTDTTFSTLLANVDRKKLDKRVEKSAELEKTITAALTSENREQYRKAVLGLLHLTPVLTPFIDLLRMLPNSTMVGGISNKVILDDRNEIAVDAILGTDRDVVAIWGASHLAGIGKSLRKNGFKLTSQQWHPAY